MGRNKTAIETPLEIPTNSVTGKAKSMPVSAKGLNQSKLLQTMPNRLAIGGKRG